MSLAYHPLPAARRTVDDSLARYVRAEYREKDACWLANGPDNGACLRMPGGLLSRSPFDRSCEDGVASKQARCCPVMETLSENRLVKGLEARGGPAGDR